jgi:hypothetical protein
VAEGKSGGMDEMPVKSSISKSLIPGDPGALGMNVLNETTPSEMVDE